MSIRKLAVDEKFSPSIAVVGEKATASYAVRQNETSGDRYALETTFDFAGVSQSELIEMACKSLIVDRQRAWRVLAASNKKEATDNNPYATVAVRELLDAPRTRTNQPPVSKAAKLFEGMSAAEKAEFMALIAGKKAA